MRVELHSDQKPKPIALRREVTTAIWLLPHRLGAKAPDPLQSISQIIKNVFRFRIGIFGAVCLRCKRKGAHLNRDPTRTRRVSDAEEERQQAQKKRCKSRYCTDFVTWILKRQIFYVTKIISVRLSGRFRQQHVSTVDNAPASVFLCFGISG